MPRRLLHRQDRNYREAIKCYRMALRIDQGNLQILRDLSFLQVQVRDLADFMETRREILTLRGGSRNNWICFAIAAHLDNKHDMAVQILTQYEATVNHNVVTDADPVVERYENSEIYMYRAMILEEAGRREEALKVLDTRADKIVDKVGALEQRARLHAALAAEGQDAAAQKHRDAAMATYRELLGRNPDNHRYHEAIQAVMGLTVGQTPDAAQLAALNQLYGELQEANPRSDTCKRFPLNYLSGAAFAAAVREFVVKPLRKGVPSLFQNLRALYADPAKGAEMGAAFAEIETALAKTKKFPGASAEEKAPESTRVYALTLLAHHKEQVGDVDGALAAIDAAIAIEPVIECYLAKASFLENAGDVSAAAAVAEEARKKDLADRYLNSVAVKRALRDGDYEGAEKTVALFARDGDQASNLYDMQCAWFENEAGRCHQRGGRRGRALKYFTAVRKHYEDMEEDQFDFHQYCLRKMTLRSYIEMLRAEDTLFNRSAYREAAKGGIEVYLDLHDNPLSAEVDAEEEMLAKMTAEERKKYRKKQRQAAERKEKEEAVRKAEEEKAAKEAAEAAAKDGKKRRPPSNKKEDPDPLGDALLKTENPLGEAEKLLEPLLRHATEYEETHLLAFEVYRRKGRLLLALRAVNGAMKAAPNSFAARRNVAHLAKIVSELPNETPAALKEVLEAGVGALTGGKSAAAYADALVTEAKSAGPLASALAAAAVGLADAGKGAAAATAAAGAAELAAASVEACVEACAVLARVGGAAAADAFKARCAVVHPYCAALGGAKAGSNK